MTSEATSMQSAPDDHRSVGAELSEIDKLERQLDRRDWLFRASFYIPLLTIAAFFLLANSTLRKADAEATGIRKGATDAGFTTDDPSAASAARALGRFAATARDVRPLIPYARPPVDPDGRESSLAIRNAVEDLASVKQLMFAERTTVEPRSIPMAVQSLLERCEAKPLGLGGACTPVAATDAPMPVYFSFGRADLTPDNRDKLRQLVTNWKALGRPHLRVTAHTDTVGAASYNSELRERRAKAVGQALKGYASKISFDLVYGEDAAPVFPGFKGDDSEYRRVVVVSFR
jgi:outer membrane protein OmpA-like peptidoglycan-associated protein